MLPFMRFLSVFALALSLGSATDAPSSQPSPAQTAPVAQAPAPEAKPAVPSAEAKDAVAPAQAAAPAASTAPKAAKAKASKGPKTPASVVITVGPNKIRKRQIDTLVDLMVKVKQAPANMDPREKQYLERMVATNLIGQELLDLEAKRLNVIADDKAIDSLGKAFKANFPNDEAFRKALKQAGDSEQGLREKMARQIKADKLLNTQMTPVGRPTPKEMQDFFAAHKSAFPLNDSLRACQILFMVDKNAGSADIQKRKADLENLRSQLAKDSAQVDLLLTRFVMKARDVSDGPEKKDGGDLQRFLPGDFAPEFKKQVSGLKVGQLSPVFRTPLGWHLVLLTERNDGKYESYQLQIQRALVQEKAAKAGKNLKKYLQTLADRYKVNYLENDYRDTSLAGVYEP
ncbi:MAG: PPIC-type domain protein [Fibrobacteres bacterium]|nr:PPIC-type domain protein [Fibrobacterota bacterium]